MNICCNSESIKSESHASSSTETNKYLFNFSSLINNSNFLQINISKIAINLFLVLFNKTRVRISSISNKLKIGIFKAAKRYYFK